ncbi:hypothetical protein [Streptomyces subrutilus]|uniref:hypothetical protein n=1 Tax=Streptomyces subrutilus TaxID=36818 RepID=UPI0033D892EB
MQTEVLVALIGLPAAALTAGIAYPVGRGVARRQAADQHAQWMRAERRNASQAYADAATGFIEAFKTSWQEIARPDYAHTRRRDIESRKQLDATLYEPLKQGLSDMHRASAAVALHGPDEVTEAAESLHAAAVEAIGHLLRFDASNVLRSIGAVVLLQRDGQAQRLPAALEDLDRAFARMAGPLGLSEHADEVERMLRNASVAAAAAQLLSSFHEPEAARSALHDLRAAVEDAPDMARQSLEPLLDLEPLVDLTAQITAQREGRQVPVAQIMSTLSAAVPAMLDMVTSMQQNMQGSLVQMAAQQDDDTVRTEEVFTAYAASLSGPLQVIQQIQQHLVSGDELAASTDMTSAMATWEAGLHPLNQDLTNQTAQTEVQLSQVREMIRPMFDRKVEESNTEVHAALEHTVQSRLDFLDRARQAIDTV